MSKRIRWIVLFEVVLLVGLFSALQTPGVVSAQPALNHIRVPLVGLHDLREACMNTLTNPLHRDEYLGASWAIDISASNAGIGTPVYAPATGRVLHAGDFGGLGLLVKIQDDHGLLHFLAHLSKIHVSTSQQVSQGQLVGFVGDTGNGPVHLHWHVSTAEGAGVDLSGVDGVDITNCASTVVGTMNGSSVSGYNSCPEYYSQGFPDVALFDHRDCQGGRVRLPMHGYSAVDYDLRGFFDDRTRSIYVPPGKSAYLSANAGDVGNPGRCIVNDMWNLDVDSYTESNPGNTRIGWQGGDGSNMLSAIAIFDNPGCLLNGVYYGAIFNDPAFNVPFRTGGYDHNPEIASSRNWLLEFSKANRGVYEFEFHTRVDTENYVAHRVLLDGQVLYESSAPEQYQMWNSYGWPDGNHTLRVEYLRTGDGGNWANALSHEEQFYLSPNRNGTTPCFGGDGVELHSGSDCITLTESFTSLDQIGWNDRNDLTITVRGDFEAWVYNNANFEGAPTVVTSGQTVPMGNNVSSVDLRTPAPPPPPVPTSAFTIEGDTRYLFPLNEGQGSSSIDIANGLVASLGSGVSWVASPYENAVIIPSGDGFGGRTNPIDVCPFTIELRFRKNSGWGRLAGQLGGNGNSGPNKWYIAFDNMRPVFEIWSGGGSQHIVSPQEITPGTWHYLMATYDCTTRVARMYLDNVLVGEMTTPATWNAGATTFEFGAVESVSRCGCEIDDIRISNTVHGLPQPVITNTFTPTATATVTPTVTPIPSEPVDSTGTGLTAEYFNNKTLSGDPAIVVVDPMLNLNAGDSPRDGVNADNFSVRWSGFIEPLYTETYTLCTVSDDGIRLWIDGILLVDNWTDHGSTEDCVNVSLMGGHNHLITVEFYDSGWSAVAELRWSSPSQVRELVPQTQLYIAYDPGITPTATHTPTPTETSTATLTPEQTGCPDKTENALFADAYCAGASLVLSTTGTYDLNALEFSYQMTSARVLEGYSLLVNNDDGESVCHNWDPWDYSQDTWPSGEGMNDSVVWVKLFSGGDCVETNTATPTQTPTASATPSVTPSPTPSPSPTLTPTASNTDTPIGCPGVATNAIVLFKDAYCSGESLVLDTNGTHDVNAAGFGYSISSIHAPDGWAVRVFDNSGRSRCYLWDAWDLSQDSYDEGGQVNDTIVSVVVNGVDCN